jgi:O-antigen ligase
MNSVKPLHWAGIGVGLGLALYFTYRHLQYFGDITFLGGVLLLEVIIACVWKFEQRFFVLLMITFAWAGMPVPLQGAWSAGRWVVLAAGAIVGFIVWTRIARTRSNSLDLIAFFCVCAAFVSASVSIFVSMAALKALSLLLLFLYCVSGGRLAALGREQRFFHGLVWGGEIVVYFSAFCYLVLGNGVWGNPNSLGAVMSVAVFPILLWGWFTGDEPGTKLRRLAALLLCTYLVHFSMERAGMIAVAVVTIVFCVCLQQYRLLVKVAALCLLLVAATGMFAPETLNNSLASLSDAVLYKGHKDEGIMGSRRTAWQRSMSTIKEHPWFGTGYGTSPTGEDPGLNFGRFNSSAETARENGNSYTTIAEWVGLLGILPFVLLLAVTISNVWKVCAWMKRTGDPRHYSIPLAMVVLAGLVHANFEDWLFAVGYYLCVYFWVLTFLLADLVPAAVVVPLSGRVTRIPVPSPAPFEAVARAR